MRNREPAVSICVPTYNGVQYLGECIGSICSQTFTDFEVVICDDESSDGTLELARQLAKGDVRFRFIANPHRFGLVGNWNNCVRQARGQWIKFLFQDDTIAPACIEKLLSASRKYDAQFSFCDREVIFEEGTPSALTDWYLGHREKLRFNWRANPVITPEQVLEKVGRDPEQNLVGEPTATLIARSVFNEVGMFDDTLIQLCDVEFWIRLMTRYGAVFVPETLVSFRVHAQATTTTNYGRREYRTMVLDALLIRYRLAFGRDYRSLRRRGASKKSALMRRLDCMMFAAYAQRQARIRSNTGSLSSEDVLAEWKAALSRHPGLWLLTVLGTVVHHFRNLTRTLHGVER